MTDSQLCLTLSILHDHWVLGLHTKLLRFIFKIPSLIVYACWHSDRGFSEDPSCPSFWQVGLPFCFWRAKIPNFGPFWTGTLSKMMGNFKILAKVWILTLIIYQCWATKKHEVQMCFSIKSDLSFHLKKLQFSIKDARSYFGKFGSVFHLKDHHTKDANLKFQLNRSNHLDIESNFVYCSCLYLTM